MNRSKFTLVRLLAVFSLTLASSLAAAADIYVSPGGAGSGGIADPTGLQLALDTARTNGQDDVIYLMEGDYDASTSGANTFEYNSVSSDDGKKVTLSGSWNSDYTAQKTWDEPSAKLNVKNTSRVLLVHADAVSFDFTIEYLDIGNGYVAVGGGHGVGLQAIEENGGAINLRIHHVGFFDNVAQTGTPAVFGGGMYSNCYFEISESFVEDNRGYRGGAIYMDDRPGGDRSLAPKIDATRFKNNASQATRQGSSIFFIPSPVITNSVFIGPDTSALGYYPASGIFGGWGGGGSLTIEGSVFIGFHASNWGAALSLWDREADISNSLFIDNHAGEAGDGKGGAIEIYDPTVATPKTVTITNSTFVGNSANGGSSFGGAIYNRVQTLNISNSIFWNNLHTDLINQGTATINHSDIEGGLAGTGFSDGGDNINSDPLFVNPSDADPKKMEPAPDQYLSCSGHRQQCLARG